MSSRKTQNIDGTEQKWLNELLPVQTARGTCRRVIFFAAIAETGGNCTRWLVHLF